MRIKPIKSEQDYEKALERLELIFDATPDTKEGDEADILALIGVVCRFKENVQLS